MSGFVYLIPLNDYPVFKVGHAKDVVARMATIGLKDYADLGKAVAVKLSSQKEAMHVEQGMKAFLTQQNNTADVPEGLTSGDAEFYDISVFSHAVDYLKSSLEVFQWHYSLISVAELVSEKSKNRKPPGRPPRGIEVVKRQFDMPVELAERLDRLANMRYGTNKTLALWAVMRGDDKLPE